MKKLSRAIAFAAEAHRDVLDKGGKPYILHCLAVMNFAMLITQDEDVLCAAVLHDTIEDTDVTRKQIMDLFGWKVLRTVQYVTKRDGESREDFIKRACSTVESAIVKACDIKHNSDLSRIKGITTKDEDRAKRYAQEYIFVRQRLQDFDIFI